MGCTFIWDKTMRMANDWKYIDLQYIDSLCDQIKANINDIREKGDSDLAKVCICKSIQLLAIIIGE